MSTYCKILLKDGKMSLPCLDDGLVKFGTMRNIFILEVRAKQQQKVPKFAALNYVDRLDEVSASKSKN
jgi:hypothetical protein